jgi:hypothetical protein
MNDDISATITAKSDQLNACDLLGGPITVKVTGVNVYKNVDQPVSIQIDGGHQPFKPCLTVRRILAKLWGPSSKEWIGQSMTLYCDESVMWAGERAGGIRVSHVTGINSKQEVVTRASKHKTMAYIIEPLVIELPAYADKSIEKNKAAWLASFDDKNTPAKLIAKIKKQYTLTEAQEQEILSMKQEQAA